MSDPDFDPFKGMGLDSSQTQPIPIQKPLVQDSVKTPATLAAEKFSTIGTNIILSTLLILTVAIVAAVIWKVIQWGFL